MRHINTVENSHSYTTLLDLYTISLTTQSIIFILFTVTFLLVTDAHRYFSVRKLKFYLY